MTLPSDVTVRHLAKVVESSDDAIISKDLNGIIQSWNRAAEQMFGYTSDEAVGRSIRMIIPADRQAEEDEVIGRIRAGQAVAHFETVRQRKDGVQIPISLSVSPIYDETGTVVGASKIARDITEPLRLRAAARESAAITQKLGEIGVMVASTLERDRIIEKVTDTAAELTHAELGVFFHNIIDSASGEAYLLRMSSGAAKGAPVRLSNPQASTLFAATLRGDRTVRLDDVTADSRFGGRSPFDGMGEGHLPVRSYLAVPVRGMEGEAIGGLFFGHSRPGLFTAEHEQMVEGIAAWASVGLENARLYAEAHEANRMKDEFLAVLSHELRTPLNAIVGYSRLLRGGILSGDKAARGLETLERNATWLTQIVEDVLDVSRIISGKIRLDVRAVDLPGIVDNAMATAQPAADAKGVRLETVIDPGVEPVAGDADRLQQVVWNLVTNAVKFTPKDGRVQVRLTRVNSYLDIVVTDTGLGIRSDFLPFVFERFRQAESGPTRKTGGLGLGLAIVRHIVEMHGGTVHASSEGEGRGSVFSVRLPLMAGRPEGPDPRREHPRAARLDALKRLGDLRGIRVVAIDDEDDALTLLRVVLEAAGAEVETVSAPAAAMERIAAVRPDVLIVDLGMPEVDGFELIRRIRASTNPDVRDVPAAALTAFARSEDRTKALRSGFEMHLAKPVDPGELVASVTTLVRRTRSTK